MFRLKFLPATIGDSIWVSYGDPAEPHHLLIDGGTRGTRDYIQDELKKLPDDKRRLELIVVSHIDKDHIGGILTLLKREEVAFEFKDLWFNAFRHLPEPDDGDDVLGALQGEAMSEVLDQNNYPWNEAFGQRGQKPVMIQDAGPLPVKTLAGGMKLTLLSPLASDLTSLRKVWLREVEEAELEAGREADEVEAQDGEDEEEELGAGDLPDIDALAAVDFSEDRSAANLSSIAFLAEFEGKRVLFAADAHAGRLRTALDRVSPSARVPLDLFKISHHGSKSTTSNSLLEKIDCNTFVFSTNGSIFRHPDDEAVARVIKLGAPHPELIFNYRRATNEIWDLDVLKQQNNYTTRYPRTGNEGIEIDV